MGNDKRVGVVVLNWNNYAASQRCIKSLLRADYDDYVIYLLDNGSTDGSRELLISDFGQNPNVVIISNGENLGFAAGCNPGIRRALDEKCDYVLLLNNDCIVYDEAFLTKAVTFAEQHPNCGIQGGRILFWPDTTRIWSTGGYISFWSGEVHLGHGQLDTPRYHSVQERSFISGALMFIKAEVIAAIGLLPDVYFFGKEEWEFSSRAKATGFKLYYNPDFSVYHEASDSHDWVDPVYVYNGTLSKILFKKRNLSKLAFWIWHLAFSFYLRVAFPLRFWIWRNRYVKGIHPRLIQSAMIKAQIDSRKTEKVTRESLDQFRSWVAQE